MQHRPGSVKLACGYLQITDRLDRSHRLSLRAWKSGSAVIRELRAVMGED